MILVRASCESERHESLLIDWGGANVAMRKARKKPARTKAQAPKAAPKQPALKSAPAKNDAPKRKGTAAKRKLNAAFMKPMTPTAALAAVIGESAMPRTEIAKRIWAYIKKNKLQDTKNKRNINADEKLKEVFGGKKQVSMFEMTKLVNRHLGERGEDDETNDPGPYVKSRNR